MRSRLTRLGVVAVGTLALLGVAAAPAHAATVAPLAFVGTATLSAPIGYPCFHSGPPSKRPLPSISVGSPKCSPATWTPKGPNTSLPATQLNLPNRRAFAFTTTTCIMAVAHINKPAPKGTDVHTGVCALDATGVVLGFCSLSQGHGTATITDPLGLTYTVEFRFTDIGGTLVVDGQVTKVGSAQTGTFVSAVQAPPPTPSQTPGQSCLAKTARQFTLIGGGTIVMT